MDLTPTETPAAPAPLTEGHLHVVAQSSIFRDPSARATATVPAGQTVLELILETNMAEMTDDGVVRLPPGGRLAITIDGEEVAREHWHLVRPKPGRLVNIFLVPKNQRQALLVGASLAIAIASAYTYGAASAAYGPVAGAIGAAAISVSGSYETEALLPLEGTG